MKLVTAILLTWTLFAGVFIYAEDPKTTHRVVIEISGDGDEHWNGLITNVKNLRTALGNEKTQIEVVVHGKALALLLGKNKEMADRLADLSREGVVFAACENTMKKQGITQDQLLPFAMTVDAGVAEVVRKQEGGWSYVRLDH